MDSALVATLLTAAGSVIVGVFAYLGVRRKSSGNVATSSDAAEIWAEGKTMREELRNEVSSYRTQLRDAEARLEVAIDKVNKLLHDVEVSQAVAEAARSETTRLRGELNHLQATMDAVHEEVKTMNGLTIAQLADNDETRRIRQIPLAKRSAGEQEHVDQAGITEPGDKDGEHSDE